MTDVFRLISKRAIRAIGAVLSIALLIGTVTGCQPATEAESNNNADAKTVIVGVNTKTTGVFNFVNENGEIDGYEYQILKKIDDKYPEYKFEYKQLDLPNTLASLDSGKIDLASSSLQLNDERKQKYGYTDQGTSSYVVRITVAENNDTVKTIRNLAGKSFMAMNGDPTAALIEQYNAKYPARKINIKYGDWTLEQLVSGLMNGAADAEAFSESSIARHNKANPTAKWKAVGEPLLQQNTRFFLNKNDTELKTKMDEAIKELRDSGELRKLSEQYLDGDFSEPVEEKTIVF